MNLRSEQVREGTKPLILNTRSIPLQCRKEIKREGASRWLDITCNVRDRDLGTVPAEIESKVRELRFDRDYHL